MKITENDSLYSNIDSMSFAEILGGINQEDQKVALAVKAVIPQIEKLANAVFSKMKVGGRLFYVGAGTSGRLAVVDASECPPTFGVEYGLVNAIIAGGDKAIRNAVEHAEDDFDAGWHELIRQNVTEKDFVIGISSSGTTPIVIGTLQHCAHQGILTGAITSNPGSLITFEADYSIEVDTGPEFITGSTRMKSGTAQKLILNMISTSVMIKLGKVMGNKMVDMRLSNNKLVDRGTRMIENFLKIDSVQARDLLLKFGSVRKVLENYNKK